jgi:hypothetical protein
MMQRLWTREQVHATLGLESPSLSAFIAFLRQAASKDAHAAGLFVRLRPARDRAEAVRPRAPEGFRLDPVEEGTASEKTGREFVWHAAK